MGPVPPGVPEPAGPPIGPGPVGILDPRESSPHAEAAMAKKIMKPSERKR
jgi:hypothetical protein